MCGAIHKTLKLSLFQSQLWGRS